MAYIKHYLGLLLLTLLFNNCKKLVEVSTPVTSVTALSVYTSDATAIAVLTGLYAKISSGATKTDGSITSIVYFTGLSSDDFTLWSGGSSAYYSNALSAAAGTGVAFWPIAYNYIFVCNSAIEGLNAATLLTPAVKQQLLGEAKFMRAFLYFYLVNLYGDVPLELSSDYTVNANAVRTPKLQVYAQIIADLEDAQHLLSLNYVDATLLKSTTEKIRPTSWAATALLARTYLYTGNYAGADSAASVVIGSSIFTPLPSLSSVFLKNSVEAIWQLQPVNANFNTEDARVFLLPATGPSSSNPVYLSPSLLGSFETNDLRKTSTNWVNSVTPTSPGPTYYYPSKYKATTIPVTTPTTPVSEYLMVLRLAEQYLIRAEARAQENNMVGGDSDLNIIRHRAGLLSVYPSTTATLVAAVLHERQVELFAEWGHRWFDLKRTNTIDAVMNTVCPAKGGLQWNTNQQLYPIPLFDILKDQNLVQNPGLD